MIARVGRLPSWASPMMSRWSSGEGSAPPRCGFVAPVRKPARGSRGVVRTAASWVAPGMRIPFSLTLGDEGKKALASDRKILTRWADALSTHLREGSTTAWRKFAQARVDEAYGEKKATQPTRSRARGDEILSAFSSWMDTTTGRASIQESLQTNRPLFLAIATEKRATPIGKLTPPDSPPHPWTEMMGRLEGHRPARADGSCRTGRVLVRPCQERGGGVSSRRSGRRLGDACGEHLRPRGNRTRPSRPLRDRAGRRALCLGKGAGRPGHRERRALWKRPLLSRGDRHDRALSGQKRAAVSRRPRRDPRFARQSARRLDAAYGLVWRRGDHHCDLCRRAGTAAPGEREFVRDRVNSFAATKVVLDTLQGKHAPLGGEPDFRYMLARDAEVPHEVLAFFGDKFVGQVVGPKQKVLEARRLVAASELSIPGYAALLYGWIYGKAPETLETCSPPSCCAKKSSVTRAERPSSGARAPRRVRLGGHLRYSRRSSSSLPRRWSRNRSGPAMIGSPRATSPPGRNTWIRRRSVWRGFQVPPTACASICAFAAHPEQRVPRDRRPRRANAHRRAKSGAGARVTVEIGAESPLRKQLSGSVLSAFRKSTFSIDFLGDWALVGVADRKRLANIARKFPPSSPSPRAIG